MSRLPRLSGWEHLSQKQEEVICSIDTTRFPEELDMWTAQTLPSPGMNCATYTAVTLVGGTNPFLLNEKINPGTEKQYRIRHEPDTHRSRIIHDVYRSTPHTGDDTRDSFLLIEAYQAISQLASFDPARRGLIPRIAFPNRSSSGTQNILRTLFAAGLPSGGTVHDGIIGTIHPAWMTGMYGWFPADTDIHQFGTLFLGMQIENSPYGGKQWGLYLNGLPHPIRTVSYAASAELEALALLLHTTDQENALIMYALQYGFGTVREAEREFREFRGLPYSPAISRLR